MGRPKTYDRDQLTDAAMQLFWTRGYHATSMRDVASATGVNPYSIYAEFESKQALYQAVTERYDQVVVTEYFGELEEPSASLEEVAAVLRFFAAASGSAKGCLQCNAATEQAPTIEQSQASTARYVARLAAAFGNALRNADAAGRLARDASVPDLAHFFTVLVIGMFVLLRAGGDPRLLQAAADQGLARLASVTRND